MIVTRPGNRSGHRTRLTGLLWRFSLFHANFDDACPRFSWRGTEALLTDRWHMMYHEIQSRVSVPSWLQTCPALGPGVLPRLGFGGAHMEGGCRAKTRLKRFGRNELSCIRYASRPPVRVGSTLYVAIGQSLSKATSVAAQIWRSLRSSRPEPPRPPRVSPVEPMAPWIGLQ
jgi:hypothetical protein